ncbi:protein-L-isoaspartate(D-aspartate) O-methyltransferase [Gammaproteobacteria bacterium]|jgi:protein-L-isoaspartate(D-aspartate) O-methyltransferase|nr:protein-L-isoaspartate(D-aspartate) O-methyltransferase [Gammaproteobacteria bacterium]MDA7856459.1 protein-L-isoaspartate(D-aspartate) O-methyltransferase [Gammaproteobacteria bacterium]MDA8696354.1 protein-L-isoaspartate(D-aspartate) O-methyltransferase [Gammaproteobacteria bacterium]MDA8856942.1 protein-L-isoaspartate(D-aspartate) O-methyltransferase [Gammaproteobacteria bacterium]MDA9044651.1 protein-L-isoaspartate(D-aspartate) O-methyltransferase [Gammaproteobacteria bacterium]|tara:strand:+ start:13310 stop:13993 length:684 start_codon:yes stop_codon:yes gene_type:complete
MSNSGFTFRRVREEMIENLLNMGIKDFRVLDAISQVPRHIFVDEALWSRAYENRSLTIGYKQTISQPYIVAKMTELLISHTKARGKILNNVLELGTGCGYQTAVLSYFSENIYSIERIKPLVSKARENLNELKIRNVELIHGDGFVDWDNKKKYDGVICAAAPREYPHDLVDNLNVSAKIVIPVGSSKSQKLNVINKISTEEIEQDLYDDVSFVPMLPGKSDDGLDS